MPRIDPELRRTLVLLPELLGDQAQVCTVAQARALGIQRDALARLAAAGRWQRLHRGVYLARRGEPGLLERMWAAHLALGPDSVIGGRVAGHYWGIVDDAPGPITVLMPHGSRRTARNVVIRRLSDPAALAHPVRTPAVLTVEHTVVDLVASARTDAQAVEAVLRACRLRLTTPERILAASEHRPRVRRRVLLRQVCASFLAGRTSPLERLYAARVTRPHGLPAGRAQVRSVSHAGGSAYRDVAYEQWGVLVELDGRLGHEEESDVLRDQLRDNAATLQGWATLRFGWLAVTGQACVAAEQTASLLARRGWTGSARPCRPGCPVGRTAA